MNFQESVTRVLPKIIGVGKNYLKHVIEMGGKDIPSEPIIFLKPWTSLSYSPHQLKLSNPSHKHQIHHEIELGVVLGKSGEHIPKKHAHDYVAGYFLLLDLTDRGNYSEILDMQGVAKKGGLPWDLSKGQNNFCPVSPLIPAKHIKDPYALELHLQINGKTVQRDITGNMHYKIEDIIEYVSKYMTLNEGDLILTGTPDGVGPICVGDKVEGRLLEGENVVSKLSFEVV